MKRRSKGRLSLLLFVVMLCAAPPVLACTVKYEGSAQRFVFVSQNQYNETDLFDHFKDVMPGDTVTQTIDVRNDGLGEGSINVYLRAQVHDEKTNVPVTGQAVVHMQDFLSQLSMRVMVGGDQIYNASPDQLHGLRNNVLLGRVDAGKSIAFTVELSVPMELGNEYANRVGEVDWVFVVEEAKDAGATGHDDAPSPAPDIAHGDWISPQTSDEANVLFWIALLALFSLIAAPAKGGNKTVSVKKK